MKRLLKKKAVIDIYEPFIDWQSFEEALLYEHNFEPFEQYYIGIGSLDVKVTSYLISIEGWYDDCLESIDMGETKPENIENLYLQLMENQFGYKSEKHNYLPKSRLSEYGVSYIAKEVDI